MLTREEYAVSLRQEILIRAGDESRPMPLEDVFTERALTMLNDLGETSNAETCSFSALGMKISGYDFSEEDVWINLFVSEYRNNDQTETLSKADVDTAFKRVKSFFDKSRQSYFKKIDEASAGFDISHLIFEMRSKIERVRFYFLTDGLVKNYKLPKPTEENGITIEYNLWDFESLYRHDQSGAQLEKIELDLKEDFDTSLPCIKMPDVSDVYDAYLTVLPAASLVKIYEQYGARLLERNVRSFLQARGNINKGIRKTIKDEPFMFFAYNNGLSATAEKVTVEFLGGGMAITQMSDFQIVNGGQTTGSLHAALKKDKADLENIFVPMKLSVIKHEEQVEDVVRNISQYANSQNKIQTADFSANDEFHRKMQDRSRTIWAPAVDGSQRQTKWFYERARGQYVDEKSRRGTDAKQREFLQEYPVNQMFSKTDLAKYEQVWAQFPHVVCQGGQKNFEVFTVRLKESIPVIPDERYYNDLIAKAILFRSSETLYKKTGLKGYRANVIAYSLAWLCFHTGQRINLYKIWRKQKLSENLEKTLLTIFPKAYEHITNPAGGGNITTWYKGAKCWDAFKNVPITIPDLKDELSAGITVTPDDQEALGVIESIRSVPMQEWRNIQSWGRQTRYLDAHQQLVITAIIAKLSLHQAPSRNESQQAEIILQTALAFGYQLNT